MKAEDLRTTGWYWMRHGRSKDMYKVVFWIDRDPHAVSNVPLHQYHNPTFAGPIAQPPDAEFEK